jgi:hypothetical protein
MSDAGCIPELIRQGSTENGLKEARMRAARVLHGYPRNGCAVHLSALLQQAGIDVTMTRGAGKLARMIERRGWRRVRVGEQAPGDIGVTYDNDPTPPGADHVYVVIEARGPDEMMIADNQRREDAPHRRFASGKGKTPTEYFLRV